MTAAVYDTGTTRPGTDSTRRTAFVAGVLYLLTFVTSIPALLLYDSVLHDPGYVVGPGPDAPVLTGGLLEVLCAMACIGTAVVLFPVVRRQSEVAALGFLAARGLEAAIIVLGVISLLSIVTLRQPGATGADAASLVIAGKSLVAVHDWTFLLGPGIIPAVNACCLGYALYRSRLVPRIIPLAGLVGAPLLVIAGIATLFGVNSQLSVLSGVATLPIFLWEGSLGIWLVVRGFTAPPAAG